MNHVSHKLCLLGLTVAIGHTSLWLDGILFPEPPIWTPFLMAGALSLPLAWKFRFLRILPITAMLYFPLLAVAVISFSGWLALLFPEILTSDETRIILFLAITGTAMLLATVFLLLSWMNGWVNKVFREKAKQPSK